ncbi:hypothetical protein [Sphingosinicella sp. BN140058]|uniref:hypothetical protein n=1 Tax=Sphingosinicella sp. BN140058 TaxID=1892855 RepID=UPI0010102FEF|nr:hypothetical protein [Sphingosinicella sp. BN140058]QAY75180.1 hypothetical protein ETR14_00520 [Sphingosinicella sp. BN140058]
MTIVSHRRYVGAIMGGFGLGLVVGLAAIIIAIASAGAGHGHYGAARALFPVPMLSTLVNGDRIGPISLTLGLLQFPVYGAILLWCVARRKYVPASAVLVAHLVAAMACFSGAISNFS